MKRHDTSDQGKIAFSLEQGTKPLLCNLCIYLEDDDIRARELKYSP